MHNPITAFFTSPSFGVIGASNDRSKFGNRVLRKYLEKGLTAYPVNPNADKVEGLKCFKSVSELPAEVKSVSIITPPAVTEVVVREAVAKGIENIWMQPGAESAAAVAFARQRGVNVIADGSCVLVELDRRG
jgi:predicted CoA-binding protein